MPIPAGEGLSAHNPKVLGSSSTPAAIEAFSGARVRWGSCASGEVQNGPLRPAT